MLEVWNVISVVYVFCLFLCMCAYSCFSDCRHPTCQSFFLYSELLLAFCSLHVPFSWTQKFLFLNSWFFFLNPESFLLNSRAALSDHGKATVDHKYSQHRVYPLKKKGMGESKCMRNSWKSEMIKSVESVECMGKHTLNSVSSVLDKLWFLSLN